MRSLGGTDGAACMCDVRKRKAQNHTSKKPRLFFIPHSITAKSHRKFNDQLKPLADFGNAFANRPVRFLLATKEVKSRSSASLRTLGFFFVERLALQEIFIELSSP